MLRALGQLPFVIDGSTSSTTRKEDETMRSLMKGISAAALVAGLAVTIAGRSATQPGASPPQPGASPPQAVADAGAADAADRPAAAPAAEARGASANRRSLHRDIHALGRLVRGNRPWDDAVREAISRLVEAASVDPAALDDLVRRWQREPG